MKFELMVAVRYLKARRKQAVISLITVISVAGVAAGVAALIIALAINAGVRDDLEEKLLGAQAHVSLLPKGSGGIAGYEAIIGRVERVDGVVVAAPAIHQNVLISSGVQNRGVVMKGVVPDMEAKMSKLFNSLVEGRADFNRDSIVLGQELADALGTFPNDRVKVLSAETRLTPLGAVPRFRTFEVAGIFSSGLYDYDASWVYVSMEAAQRLLAVGDVATTIEVRVDDIYRANEIGRAIVSALDGDLDFTDWIGMNRSIFEALRLERLVMVITIGLIVVVAALNIVATLTMMVLEKTRDIAVLMSMGATEQNIRKIFNYQGLVIGVVGTLIGLVLGHVLSYVADAYRLIPLAPEVYTVAYVPFKASFADSAIVAISAVLISYLATLYPSRAAASLRPVEALRYE